MNEIALAKVFANALSQSNSADERIGILLLAILAVFLFLLMTRGGVFTVSFRSNERNKRP